MLAPQVLPQEVALFTSVLLAQWGMKKTPTDGSFTLQADILLVFGVLNGKSLQPYNMG
jgi:hypothetical protein